MARQHVKHRFTAYKLNDRNVGLAFNEEVVGGVNNSMWNDDISTQEKCKVLCDGFVAGAKVVLSEDCLR